MDNKACFNELVNEMEKYLAQLIKSRVIQINTEKKLREMLKEARQILTIGSVTSLERSD